MGKRVWLRSGAGLSEMKPELQEIERLHREVAKLKAERDILKNRHGSQPPVRGKNRKCYPLELEGSGRQLI